MEKERLDKLLAGVGTLSRKDVKSMVRDGRVSVNGVTVTDAGLKVSADTDTVCVDGTPQHIQKHVYIMLNKPAGVVSASHAKEDTTVVDLVPPALRRSGLFPAGRLDKDTTGFVLLTDDGDFAHRILSPKNHIPKTYTVGLADPVTEEQLLILREGLELYDGTRFLPAQVVALSDDRTRVQITICEGKYHQIKRMFAALGRPVQYLERTHMGSLPLDPDLPRGACRELTEEERRQIESYTQTE